MKEFMIVATFFTVYMIGILVAQYILIRTEMKINGFIESKYLPMWAVLSIVWPFTLGAFTFLFIFNLVKNFAEKSLK